MAYKTNWKLSGSYIYRENKEIPKEDIDLIQEYIEDNEDMSWIFSEGFNEWGEDDRSFTDAVYNMYKLSTAFPQILFVLKCQKIYEADEGQYTEYWLNGKVQRTELEYYTPEFNANALESEIK